MILFKSKIFLIEIKKIYILEKTKKNTNYTKIRNKKGIFYKF